MTEIVKGDLFDPAWNFDAIGHGVNCKGLMGAGIAVAFKQKFPGMHKRYVSMCEQGFLLPGMAMPYPEADGKWIYNIASQYNPGANADLRYLRTGLEYVRFHMQIKEIESLGLPWIGAGIGGLTKRGVYAIVDDVFRFSGIDATIVSLED